MKSPATAGESGSGKSVAAQTILRLLPVPKAKINYGKILLNGQDLLAKSTKQMEAIRGKDIGMIFQDPMTSLNPTIKVGKQITEVLINIRNVSGRSKRARDCNAEACRHQKCRGPL